MTPLTYAQQHAPLFSLFALTVTLGAYALGSALQSRLKTALTNPVLFAILVVAAALKLTHTPYEAYVSAAQPISLLLGPATISLAVPLARSRQFIRPNLLPLLGALVAGALTNAVSGYAVARFLGASPGVALSLLPKGATTPIAIGTSAFIGGIPALTAVMAISAGILVAIFIEPLFRRLRISDWRSIGLAAGVAGSGIGASSVLSRDPIAAAFAAIALVANGVLTAVLAPILAALLKQ